MKKTLHLLIILSFTAILNAQNINVVGFKALPNDMSARVDFPRKDQNGEKSALIKLETTQKGFVFEGGSLGIVATEQKTGEIWVYVPRGARRLTIKHNVLGVLRNYEYPIPIESATVYQMKITSAKITTIIEEPEILSEWLIITSEPGEADVYIDNKYMGKTPFQKMVEVGRHQYRVSKNMYRNAAGVIELNTTDGKIVKHLNLKPAFGNLKINTYPEQGAEVYLNNKLLDKKTPCEIPGIPSGTHSITLKHYYYEPLTINTTIYDDSTTTEDVSLKGNFVYLHLQTGANTEIFIDNQHTATAAYKKRTIPGIYKIEFKKDRHYTHSITRKLEAGDTLALKKELKPITGNLNIKTIPFDAEVRVNGVLKGKTPILIRNIGIGNNLVEISKFGYANYSKNILIQENETSEIDYTFEKGRKVSVVSTPDSALVTINNHKVGYTPLEFSLEEGGYNMKIEKDFYYGVEQQLQISNSQPNYHIEQTLKPAQVLTTFQCTPKNSKLLIDNKRYGPANNTYPLHAGMHPVKVQRRSFKTIEDTIEVGKNSTFNYNLEPASYRSKAKALMYSAIWPGAGQCYLKREGADWLYGLVVYGTGVYAYVNYNKAVEQYDEYLAENIAAQRQSLKTEYKQTKQQAEYLMYTAAALWGVNIVWTSFMKNDTKRFGNFQPSVMYNHQSNALELGVNFAINNK